MEPIIIIGGIIAALIGGAAYLNNRRNDYSDRDYGGWHNYGNYKKENNSIRQLEYLINDSKHLSEKEKQGLNTTLKEALDIYHSEEKEDGNIKKVNSLLIDKLRKFNEIRRIFSFLKNESNYDKVYEVSGVVENVIYLFKEIIHETGMELISLKLTFDEDREIEKEMVELFTLNNKIERIEKRKLIESKVENEIMKKGISSTHIDNDDYDRSFKGEMNKDIKRIIKDSHEIEKLDKKDLHLLVKIETEIKILESIIKREKDAIFEAGQLIGLLSTKLNDFGFDSPDYKNYLKEIDVWLGKVAHFLEEETKLDHNLLKQFYNFKINIHNVLDDAQNEIHYIIDEERLDEKEKIELEQLKSNLRQETI